MKTEMDTQLIPQPSPLTGQYRDFFSSPGDLPMVWQQLMLSLYRQGNTRLKRHCKEAQRLLKENGAIHNVFSAPDAPRPWAFDPIPLIFDPEEWAVLEQGLVQRAELLNLVLADIYGPMTLVKEGILPPELIFSHRGFLYPCVGTYNGLVQPLTFYSANLAKGTDGSFWVMDDHIQPPLGSGYALEIRIIMNRSFPQLFEKFQVHRLAMYYRALRNGLTLLAKHNCAEPRIVVLTPGPEDPGYFEHAYLASYLGYPLVQGGDLIVRDSCVWLKSVDGLRQVDVILRRQEDNLCDPLELRGDSFIGIPGLLEAIRCGNVAVANPIGSGILENPALMAFLPTLCEHFFQRKLLLPSVATWWCGQREEREFVLENLDKLVIKPIHPLPNLPAMIVEQAGEGGKKRWKELIRQSPHLFVGQERINFATFPAFETDRIEARHSSLSLFLTAQSGSYVAMPGGLCRAHTDSGQLLQAEQAGGQIKDTWVLTSEPDKQVTLWRQVQPNQQIKPLVSPLPSQAAENLFWAGRYAERAEQTARLLRSILAKLREVEEFHDNDDRMSLHHLLRALTHVTLTYPGFTGDDAKQKLADPRAELSSLISASDRPGSLRSSLLSLGRCASVVRDLLPADAWRVIDNMQTHWNPRVSKQQLSGGRVHESINNLILQLSAFSGLAYENMSRETAWLMLNIGRRLERALNLTALLRATLVPCFGPAMEAQMLETVLNICNSLIVYRRRYRSFMELSTILELLLMDENYPRALASQLRQLQFYIRDLPVDAAGPGGHRDVLLIDRALDNLRQTDPKQLIQITSSDGHYPLLEKMLTTQQEDLEQLSTALTEHFFTPSLALQQLGNLRRDSGL